MSDKVIKKAVLALGYFDSVHKGHREVIARARALADETGAELVVFTFKGNLKAMLSGDKDKYVYAPQERESIYKSLGADEIYYAPVDFGFLSLGKLAFLNKMCKKYDVAGYVCGKDYKFGKFASGNVDDLAKYADGKNQKLIVVDDVTDAEGKKISTSRIKKLLNDGNVKKAAELLGESYFVTGTVKEDRGVGTQIGCPTVNLKIETAKQHVKDGVYAGRVTVGDKTYRAVINFGPRPTFDVNDKMLEAHILDFNENIYGEKITVYFDAYIREIQKFVSPEKLKEQLDTDIKEVGEGKYD